MTANAKIGLGVAAVIVMALIWWVIAASGTNTLPATQTQNTDTSGNETYYPPATTSGASAATDTVTVPAPTPNSKGEYVATTTKG